MNKKETKQTARLRSVSTLVVAAVCSAFAGQASASPVDEKCAAIETGGVLGVESASFQVGQVLKKRFSPVPINLPPHCEVVGKLDERTGIDGQQYAIRYHVRLPDNWNGRFFFEGGGGTNGNLGDAVGDIGFMIPTALAQGYAVVSQDSGHSNELNTNPMAGGQAAFGLDPEARANYGHASLKRVSDTAKQLVTEFYGRDIEYAYFVGCSKGGQEGMAFAQKYPTVFDGIVASAPGFSLPKAAVAQIWDVQTFGALVQQEGSASFPFHQLPKAFSKAQLGRVQDAVLKACDSLDGLEDGIVGAFRQCSWSRVAPELKKATCTGGAGDACLSEAQVEALRASVEGPKDTNGEPVYVSWPWDAGIGSDGWAMWKLGNERMPALNVITGGSAMATMFTVPPTKVKADPQSLADYEMSFSVAEDAAKIYATSDTFPRSAWQDISARSANLDAFKANGGKLLVPHGVSDPVFSITDTINWYEEVDARYEGGADTFTRVFPVPGMAHCFGGPATNGYNAFDALTSWVEEDRAPDYIIARAGPGTPWPGRSRPLCPFPTVATYTGTGSTEKAENFTCEEVQ